MGYGKNGPSSWINEDRVKSAVMLSDVSVFFFSVEVFKK